MWQTLALGYLTVVLTGSALLILPFATVEGESTTYLGALFTSASATCVTGLTPYATGTHWTRYGQIVILILIQLGGLGFMTFVSSLFLLFRRGMKLGSRRALLTSAGGSKFSGVSVLVKRIFAGTAIFETLGAALLAIRFVPDFGWGDGIFFSVFHSVSAFCNAGFDLLASAGSASLSMYATDPLVTLTICALIVIGGLGFCVWGDVIDCRFRFRKFQLNTKVVLVMTGALIVFSTALFLGFEWNGSAGGYSFGQKLLLALFNAITPRTAGFFTTDPTALSDSGYLLTLVLMFIGGSSGSTAGGLKVGTFAVIIMGMFNVFRGQKEINMGKKRIDYSLVSQALAIFAACLMLIITATIAICAIEHAPEASCKAVIFECFSAMGTVGLTMNLTPSLSAPSQIIIIFLMYAGRVGILTLALALAKKRRVSEIRYPLDTLLIG